MKARQVTLGIMSYIMGAAVLLIIALAISGHGLLEAVDASDAIILILGGVLIGLAAIGLQSLEVMRPTPGGGEDGKGGRPKAKPGFPQNDFSWTSLAAIFGAAIALAVAPVAEATEERVESARGTYENLVIDGDRDGTLVSFVHDHADERWTGQGRPCARCHHLNLPGEEATPCSECHTSMTRESDIFDHDLHAEAEGGNSGCDTCHDNPNEPRERETMAFACNDCHTSSGQRAMHVMVPPGATVEMENGIAPSYVDAMHRLCMDCHETIDEDHAQCSVCHRTGEIRDGQPRPGR